MPNCLCTLPPVHTTDQHKSMQALASLVDLTCKCGVQPTHSGAQHDAIKKVAPVFPAPVAKCFASINLLGSVAWPPHDWPVAATMPRARFWDTGTGRPDPHTSAGQQQISSFQQQYKVVQTHGNFAIDWQLGIHGATIPLAEHTEIVKMIAGLIRSGYSQIKSVELCNEPEVQGTSLDLVGEYAKAAYPILDPLGCLVVGPSTQSHDPTHFNYFMSKYAQFVHIGAHHIYADRTGSTVYADQRVIADKLMATAKAHGKPLWITEWNLKKSVYPAGSVTDARAQSFVADTMKAYRDAGIAEMFLWHWNNKDQPFCPLTSGTLNADGKFYVDAAAKLVGGTL